MARAGGLRAARRDLAGSRPTGTPTSPPAGPEAEFLAVLLERRREEVEERVLRALSILGVPEASGVIRRCLRASDPEIRAQALEAIDVLGDRRIARALVRLIEDDPDEPAERIETILDRLADDRDPWIRALALRALARRQADAGRALADRIRDDPDPLVREAAGQPEPDGGGQMPETRDTLGLVDRVLFLRGVPIFARLSPEHLQRIATAASERLYPAGERIFREGDLGDEMLVIVEGRVRIVKRDGDGERFITALGPGAPVGELAVLREMPRAATVIAEEPGVRCLAIAGEGLTAILRERPEAAMAMLATLADRLSRT
jgi:hypothetical protein